jgi:branched-chain amino acid transport system permease protein
LVLLIASFGVFIVIGALIQILFSSQFQTLTSGFVSNTTISTGLGIVTKIQLLIILSAPIIFFFLTLLLRKTSFGRAVRAINDDEEVASISGVNTRKIILIVFVITTAIAGVACILDGFDIGISPSLGLIITLKAIIASIIGGYGSITGGFIGGYILGGLENTVAWNLGGEWQDAAAFVVLIIFLIFRPRGILGKK